MQKNESRLKMVLLIVLVLFIISNVAITILFKYTVSQEITNCSQCFNGDDSTSLIVIIGSLTSPWEPRMQVLLIGFRVVAMFISIIISLFLLTKERLSRNVFYAFSCVYTFVVQLTSIEVASSGIYNFFQKLYVAHYLGMIQFPWIIYNLIVILPIIITVVLLSIELRKTWKLEKKAISMQEQDSLSL